MSGEGVGEGVSFALRVKRVWSRGKKGRDQGYGAGGVKGRWGAVPFFSDLRC